MRDRQTKRGRVKEELLDVLIKKVRKRCKGQMCKDSTDRIE